MVADYALSGEAMLRLRAKLILKYPEGRDSIENLDEVFSADPAQMEQLLDHLRERYGTVDAYVAGLGRRPPWSRASEPGCSSPLIGLGRFALAVVLLPDVGPHAVDGAGERQVEQGDAARVVGREGQADRVPPDVDVGVVVGRLGGGADGVDELEGGGEVVQLDHGHQDVTLAGPVQVLLVERRGRRRPG